MVICFSLASWWIRPGTAGEVVVVGLHRQKVHEKAAVVAF